MACRLVRLFVCCNYRIIWQFLWKMHKKHHEILFLFVECDIVDFLGKRDNITENKKIYVALNLWIEWKSNFSNLLKKTNFTQLFELRISDLIGCFFIAKRQPERKRYRNGSKNGNTNLGKIYIISWRGSSIFQNRRKQAKKFNPKKQKCKISPLER